MASEISYSIARASSFNERRVRVLQSVATPTPSQLSCSFKYTSHATCAHTQLTYNTLSHAIKTHVYVWRRWNSVLVASGCGVVAFSQTLFANSRQHTSIRIAWKWHNIYVRVWQRPRNVGCCWASHLVLPVCDIGAMPHKSAATRYTRSAWSISAKSLTMHASWYLVCRAYGPLWPPIVLLCVLHSYCVLWFSV